MVKIKRKPRRWGGLKGKDLKHTKALPGKVIFSRKHASNIMQPVTRSWAKRKYKKWVKHANYAAWDIKRRSALYKYRSEFMHKKNNYW
jgi:hypothetical protein